MASGRDFDPATGQLAAGADVATLDETTAHGLTESLRDAPFQIVSVDAKSFTERPKPPFTTSTLQQEAARKLGFTAARTMAVAQGLYEHGYITYMRTDATFLSEQAITAARHQIAARYSADDLPSEPRQYRGKVKNAQEAHEAIRPAGDQMRVLDDVAGELNVDERRIYELIWKRTVACQMADARIRRVTIRLVAPTPAGEEATFQATGRTIEFPGYLRAYVEGADDPDAELEDREVILPSLEEGDPAQCRNLEPSSHTTQPPARYTEASLVKDLEERGIGRPSTYAVVIDTLLRRDYVWKKGSALVPTWTAFAKQQLLERFFAHLIDYDFTAGMEEALDAIARGEGEAEKWLHAFWFGNGQTGLKDLVNEEHLATIDPAEVNAVPIGSDSQGREIIVRVWNNGASVVRGEERAPVPVDLPPDELTIEKAEDLLEKGAAGPRVLGADPDTTLPVLALTGRYGPFVQLGEMEDGSKEKPKRASLFSDMQVDTITLDQAVQLLSLPRTVGETNDGVEITALNGRYGPYLKKGTESRSLETEAQLFTITVDQAEVLFAQPKRRGRRTKPPIAELGAHPDSGAAVRVLDGRYGPYVTDGELNATVPRGVDPASIDLDQAVELLRERAARGPSEPKAKKTAKKATKKKATKKKATPRKTPPSMTRRTIRKGATRP
jgi:DNA topoisomerase-1